MYSLSFLGLATLLFQKRNKIIILNCFSSQKNYKLIKTSDQTPLHKRAIYTIPLRPYPIVPYLLDSLFVSYPFPPP